MPTVTANDVQLHYEIAGSGAPLLLIHGLGSSGADWKAQIEYFARRYKVIAPDLRGHGGSAQPRGPYSMKLFADDLTALLKTLGTGPAHVVGISLGGGVAFQFALDHPALTRSLTIVNSAPEMILRTFAQKFAIWQRLVIIRLMGLPRMGEVLAGRLFPKPEHAAARAGFVERFGKNQREPYLASLHALIGWSVTDRLGELQCPTLVMTADQDYTPVSLKEAYVARLPNAKLVVIPDSRHFLPMERPAEFNEALAGFLAATGQAGSSDSEIIRRRTLPIA